MTRRTVAATMYYGGLGVLLLLVVTGSLHWFLPDQLATRIGFNSEGYLLALVLAMWIQFARPKLEGSRGHTWILAWSVAWLALGVYLYQSSLPSSIKTLNETAVAVGLLIPYVSLRRPVPIWVRALPALVVLIVVGGLVVAPDSIIRGLAETFGFLILVPIALDLVDRGILDPAATTSRLQRLAWYGFLIAEPVLVSLLGVADRSMDQPIGVALDYLGRIHESFIGTLLISLYFAVLLRRTGRERADAAQSEEVINTHARQRQAPGARTPGPA